MDRSRKLKPLEQWFCDACGQVIETASDGWLEWVEDDRRRAHGFKIVHHAKASPRKQGCYRDPKELALDMHLHHVLEGGIAVVLAELDEGDFHDPGEKHPGVVSVREWANLVRRLWVPFWEQARFLVNEDRAEGELQGVHETALYARDLLEGVVDRYVNDPNYDSGN